MNPIQRLPSLDRRPIGAGLRILGACIAVLALCGRAEAQFGFGGFGYGIFARPYTPPSVHFLYSRANVRAGMNQRELNSPSLTAPQGRYDYRERQVAMQQRYNFQTQRVPDVDYGRRGTPIPGSEVVPGEAPAANIEREAQTQVPPITSFVNENNQVVWPADAPVTGDLASKRDQADKAIQQVVQEYQAMDYADIDSVAQARQELLDYGRPALESVRQQSTARVADTFHLFLLSLYESLAQAARQGQPATS